MIIPHPPPAPTALSSWAQVLWMLMKPSLLRDTIAASSIQPCTGTESSRVSRAFRAVRFPSKITASNPYMLISFPCVAQISWENRFRYFGYSNGGLAFRASFVAPARTSLLSTSFN